jgi:hypothetical protein
MNPNDVALMMDKLDWPLVDQRKKGTGLAVTVAGIDQRAGCPRIRYYVGHRRQNLAARTRAKQELELALPGQVAFRRAKKRKTCLGYFKPEI